MPSNVQNVQGANPNSVVIARVSAEQFPQVIIGHVWRYLANSTKDGRVGMFSTRRPDVPLGTPASFGDRIFLVTGMVLNMEDNPPTPYQVDLELLQNNTVLARLQVEGGQGTIGTDDEPIPRLT